MQSFIVEATNRPGELARVANTIAGGGINLEAFSLGHGTHGALAFRPRREGPQECTDRRRDHL